MSQVITDQLIIDTMINWCADNLSEDEFSYALANQPESYVFCLDIDDYGYDEDSFNAISDVTNRDRMNKVRYWCNVVENNSN